MVPSLGVSADAPPPSPGPSAGTVVAAPQASRRLILVAFGLLALVELVVVLAVVRPGYMSIDEVTHNFMLKSLVEDRSFTIWNGFEEHPSVELTGEQVSPVAGHLAAQYPYFFSLLAAPLYGVFGFRAPFLLNALGVLLAVAATFLLGRRLFDSVGLAATAAATLVATTYLGEYAHAAWPHGITVGLTTTAFYVMVQGLDARGREALRPCLLSGLLGGLATGMRLDALFLLPTLVLPFVFASPARLREAVMVALGSAPAFLGQALINHVRFGSYAPVSYGDKPAQAFSGSLVPYLQLAVLGMGAVALAWTLSRRWTVERLQRALPSAESRRNAITLVLVATGVLVLFVPTLRPLVPPKIRGLAGTLLDMRLLRPQGLRPFHVAAGLIYYAGVPKKALLQSCPLLVAAALPILDALSARRERREIALLTLVPLVVCGVFGTLSWHGGGGVNLRYLLPALPFLSLLAVMPLRDAAHRAGPARTRTAILGGAALAVLAYVALTQGPLTGAGAQRAVTGDVPVGSTYLQLQIAQVRSLSRTHLTTPLILAAALLGALLVGRRYPLDARVGTASVAVAAACATWGGIFAYVVDGSWAAYRRGEGARVGAELAALVPDDALLFVSPAPDPFFSVMQHRRRLRLALPQTDGYADFESLASFHLGAGRRVFACLPLSEWKRVDAAHLLAGFHVTPLLTDTQRMWGVSRFQLAELTPGVPPPVPTLEARPVPSPDPRAVEGISAP